MQQFIATLLTCCLLFNVACTEKIFRQNRSTNSSVSPAPKPVAVPISTATPVATTPSALQQNAQYKILRDAILAAASKGKLFIKDANGKPVTMDAYEAAPDQYYLLFSDKGRNLALRSSVAPQVGANKQWDHINVKVEISKIPSLTDFSKDKITGVLMDDSVTLGLAPAAVAGNTIAIKNLAKKIKESTELAANTKGTLEKFSEFLFPTAYADSDTLKYVAIGVSIAAGVSVLLAMAGYTGWVSPALWTIATAVMWTLYFVERDKEDDANAGGGGTTTALATCEVANLNNTTPATKVCAQFNKFAPNDPDPELRKTDCESDGGTWTVNNNCSTENILGVCHPSTLAGEEVIVLFYPPQTAAQAKVICETDFNGVWEP